MRRRILIGIVGLCVIALSIVAGGKLMTGSRSGPVKAQFRGFGDSLPPAQLEMGGNAPIASPGLPPLPAAPVGGLSMADVPPPSMPGQGMPMVEAPPTPQMPGMMVSGGMQPATPGGFGGFGAQLPPAPPAGGQGIASAAGGMQGMDVGALMNAMGSQTGVQMNTGDMSALLSSLQGMQGQTGGMGQMGGMAGPADMTAALSMLGGIYGADVSGGLDPALIQQGILNLQEMQSWEGMEGIDFGPLVQMLQSNQALFQNLGQGGQMGGMGTGAQIDPNMLMQLMGQMNTQSQAN
jgi:hypothetical protein